MYLKHGLSRVLTMGSTLLPPLPPSLGDSLSAGLVNNPHQNPASTSIHIILAPVHQLLPSLTGGLTDGFGH